MANLIGFDKNRENVEFRGPCKLSINFMSKYLFVEPKNEEFKLISASFKWHYIMKKNILFVFAEHNFLDFCLVFMNEQICKKTYNYIASGKDDTEVTTEEQSIDDGFITPIFQRIAENPTFQASMIETVATWHQLLEDDDKQRYSQMMMDYGIYDLIMTDVPTQLETRQDVASSRKRKFLEVKKEVIPKIEVETEYVEEIYSISVPASQFKLVKLQRFRRLIVFTSDEKKEFHECLAKSKYGKFKCVTCDRIAVIDINEYGEFVVMLKDEEHSCKPSTKKIPSCYRNVRLIHKPAYEIFQNCAQYSNKYLIVFASADKKQCYEYNWDKSTSKFYCHRCRKENLSNKSTAIIFNEGTSKEFVGIISENHKCQPIIFKPEKYQQCFDYVLKPDFDTQKFIRNGKEGKRLIIYDPNDRSKYYRYFYKSSKEKYYCRGCYNNGKCITANLNQNSEGEEYITISNVKHVCEMKTYVPPVNNVVFRPPEIEIMEETKNGKPRIILFENDDRSKCYVFCETHGSFYCVGCTLKNQWSKRQKTQNTGFKIVRGKLLKNEENGGYSFQMESNQIHRCEPRPYQPEQYAIQIIPKTFDYFYYRLKNGPQTVRVAIYSSRYKELCYTFAYEKYHNKFLCNECRKKKHHYRIKLQKDADGKEYFNHDFKKHSCQPVKTSSISKCDILEEHGITFESKPKSKRKFDESKIVRTPNFELRPNKAGDPDRKLITFHSDDETLCFEYFFNKRNKIYQCGKCDSKKICVSAKLHKDDENGESFIVMGKNNHVCEPQKYQPL